MCALGRCSLEDICELADAAYNDDIDLTNDDAWATLHGSGSTVQSQTTAQRESDLCGFLDGLARTRLPKMMIVLKYHQMTGS